MKVERPFKPTGKRLENLNDLIQTKYPQDKWVLEPILPIFLSIIDSSSTIEQQEQVIDLLTKIFNDYEFRYNTILENTIIMSEEFKRFQQLAGLPITENKVEETKETLNENFVGIPAINNIFDREKTDYELAFEHFTKGTSLNEIEVEEGNLGHNETASLEQEGRFWIVSWRGMNGPNEKVFTDEDEARAFMGKLNENEVEDDFLGVSTFLIDAFLHSIKSLEHLDLYANPQRNPEGYDDLIDAANITLSSTDSGDVTEEDLIEAARRFKSGLYEEEGADGEENPIDSITMDVPLFIRMLEFAREDASTDMDLHDVAEKATALSAEGEILSMDNYEDLVGDGTEITERLQMQRLAGIIK